MQVRALRDLYDSNCVLRRAGETFEFDGDPATIGEHTPFVDARTPVAPPSKDTDLTQPPPWTTPGHAAQQQQQPRKA